MADISLPQVLSSTILLDAINTLLKTFEVSWDLIAAVHAEVLLKINGCAAFLAACIGALYRSTTYLEEGINKN